VLRLFVDSFSALGWTVLFFSQPYYLTVAWSLVFQPAKLVFGFCYPRYLGITRRSCLEAHMVLDMEYREQELPEHGPGGPFFFFSARFVLPAVPASITTGLGLHQRRLLLHEVIGPRYHGMCHI
jgi:hypothetical protein